jgi:hypothetical protein
MDINFFLLTYMCCERKFFCSVGHVHDFLFLDSKFYEWFAHKLINVSLTTRKTGPRALMLGDTVACPIVRQVMSLQQYENLAQYSISMMRTCQEKTIKTLTFCVK